MRKKGEKINCITMVVVDQQKNKCAIWKNITQFKEYIVIDNVNGYTIIDDTGSLYTFPYENFHTKQELRELKINELLSE